MFLKDTYAMDECFQLILWATFVISSHEEIIYFPHFFLFFLYETFFLDLLLEINDL